MSSVPVPLNFNTLSSLILHDAAFNLDGQAVPLLFRRSNVPVDLIEPTSNPCACNSIPHTCNSRDVRRNGPPARQFIHQPPSPMTEISLQFALDQFIGSGASGIVYSTKSASISSSAYSLMPVTIKIANRNRNKSLLREAWFYDELQTLQGATISRCYGYFEAELPERCTFTPWRNAEGIRSEVNTEEFGDDYYGHLGAFNREYRDKLSRFERMPLITILILEPLGEFFLATGGGKPFPGEMMTQIRAAYHDLGCLAVEHGDVRQENILAITRETGPSLPSPYSGQHYPFRIIDFEGSQKSDAVAEFLDLVHDINIESMSDTLPYYSVVPSSSTLLPHCP